MTEWISVKDRLPDEEEDVLLRIMETEHLGRHNEKRSFYQYIFLGYREEDEWYTGYCWGFRAIAEESNERCVLKVTNWMPLPEFPQTEYKQ